MAPNSDNDGPVSGDSAITLDFRREAACFFARHLHRLDLTDLEFILALANKIPSPINGCYLIVPMHIKETALERYLNILGPQLTASGATALIFANACSADVTEAEFHSGVAMAQRAVKQSPACAQVVLATRYFDTPMTMGRIRGLMADAVLLNAYATRAEHPVIISNDIDAIGVVDSYLEQVALRFSKDRRLKLMAGVVDFGYRGATASEILSQTPVPELFVFNELNKAINRCASLGLINFETRVWIEGANAAVSGAAYCAVDGFDFKLANGEDDALGKALNRFNPNAFAMHRPSEQLLYEADPLLSSLLLQEWWVVTDPRRVLLAIASGLPGIEAWADLPFMETIGASMNSATLAIQCAQRSDVITPTILMRAAAGDHDARAAVVARLRDLLSRSIAYDRKAQNEEQVARLLNVLGLEAKAPACIQWGGGPFFSQLCNTVRS